MTNPFDGIPGADLAYFREQSERFAASGASPAVPRLAATAILLRPDGAVLLMRRPVKMVFGGRWVFPGGSADPIDAEPGGSELEIAARAALREVREETGLVVAAEQLLAWARWVTPEFEPRRFDTYFFIGLVDAETDAVEVNGETEEHRWLTATAALAGYAAGQLSMLPPTVVTLRELADLSTMDAVRAAAVAKDLSSPILPRLP
ncbi:8-oxo-dGTP pyrophosphatase MutT (NUDIX family) [Hamadaea flava]|uniref:NUDIX domain-containing protein n=1 Tax=Hamadaea flava TaxID=1742688 RepID=A0ABV8LHC0_9ACTN|nr:NUDIX hydrolase [Hamadaea flava]MCP2325709.1 8-oxo-dGTP pyrophosphatase MutT (NUDIX family) [Hamadaea flava]